MSQATLRGVLSMLILLRACVAARAAAGPPPFRAGAATVPIPPPVLPARIAGNMFERVARDLRDPLFVRAIVLDDGRTRLAFAIVDSCMMPQPLIQRARELVRASGGIPAERIIISATHTHAAPAAMGCLGTRADEPYVEQLPGRIAEAIMRAAEKLEPAQIGWASAADWRHTHNRRWIRRPEAKVVDPFGQPTGLANMHPGYLSPDVIGPSGPVDPELSVLAVRSRSGAPLAVLANYSQHYFGATPISADYYGSFCRQLAERLGQPGEGSGPFVCAMSQGTSGDLMWMDYGAPKRDLTMEQYAAGVAASAIRALEKVQYRDHAELGVVERTLPLRYRVPDESRLAWAREVVARVQDRPAKDRPEVYAQEALLLHERQRTELTLQAVRVGDLTICTLPNEVFALTGLKLKAQSPAAAHFNIELANGAEGYIPPPEQHALGGYTTWPARTAGLEEQAEPRIVETLLGALEEVTGRARRAPSQEPGAYTRAVLRAKPATYWRLEDMAGDVAANAVPQAAVARLSRGYAWYLPGAGSGSGTGEGEALHDSPFAAPGVINRAVHLAGGDLTADVPVSRDRHSVALWFWGGEPSGANERQGELVRTPGGQVLECRQTPAHESSLVLNGEAASASARADQWHFVVLMVDGDGARVHVDGQAGRIISRTGSPASAGHTFRFGRGFQGKLDEIAVFDRALSPAEVEGLWRASEQR